MPWNSLSVSACPDGSNDLLVVEHSNSPAFMPRPSLLPSGQAETESVMYFRILGSLSVAGPAGTSPREARLTLSPNNRND
jgi:hypothetical protein